MTKWPKSPLAIGGICAGAYFLIYAILGLRSMLFIWIISVGGLIMGIPIIRDSYRNARGRDK